jgi:hypothetical protein
MSVNMTNWGHQESEDVAASTKTVDITDQGVVQNVTADSTVTLPATVVGYSYTFRVGAPGITLAVSPASADLIAGNGFTAADNKDVIFTSQPAGSFVSIVGNGTTGWNISAVSGELTREA